MKKIIIMLSLALLGVVFLAGCNQQTNQTQPATNQPFANQSPQTDIWNIYKNDKYGFEFQYPKEWQAGEVNNAKSATFFQNNKDGRGHDYEFSVAVIDNINKSAAEFLMHDKSEESITREKTSFIGQEAVKITSIIKGGMFGSRGSASYHFIKDGNGFSLTYNYVGEDSSIGEKIFDSFKFTK